VGLALRALTVALLAGIMALMVANVLNRFFPVASLDWADEIIELMLVWLVFCGAAEVWRANQHFAVDLVPALVAGTRFDLAYRVLIQLGCLLFVAVFTWQSSRLFLRADDVAPYFSWPRRLWYGAMPFSGALMVLFSLRRLHAMLTARRRTAPERPEIMPVT
jgi:TRAP-type transport system small permease protein